MTVDVSELSSRPEFYYNFCFEDVFLSVVARKRKGKVYAYDFRSTDWIPDVPCNVDCVQLRNAHTFVLRCGCLHDAVDCFLLNVEQVVGNV